MLKLYYFKCFKKNQDSSLLSNLSQFSLDNDKANIRNINNIKSELKI